MNPEMICILFGIIIIESIIISFLLRRKIKKACRMIKNALCRPSENSREIHFTDEQDAWYTDLPLMILHGAANGRRCYSNSEEGIIRGAENGFKVIEVDVSRTSDGCFVLSHRFRPDGEIIFDKTPSLEEFLREGASENETALTFQDLLRRFGSKNVFFLIDCTHGTEAEFCQWISENTEISQRSCLIFQVHTPQMLKKVYDAGTFRYIHYNGTSEDVVRHLGLLQKCGVHSCSISDEEISDNNSSLDQLIRSGIHIIVYTVNHQRRLEKLLQKGIGGVFTDVLTPDSLRQK